jgi:hypothetical protein
MGRPLNKKYFANTNYQDFGTANVGGESVASVTVVTGNSAGYVTGEAVSFSAPQITGGAYPVATIIATAGAVTSVVITSAGSGYTSAPTATVTTAAGTQTTLTLTPVLTSGAAIRQNGIKCEAQVGAGAEVTTGDVIKQVNTRSYKVQTSGGVGVCKLVTTEAKDAGQMSIKATDSDGNTYFVAKLTSRKAVLVPAANVHGGTTTIGSQFASGTSAKWTFGSAVVDTTVTIDNQ